MAATQQKPDVVRSALRFTGWVCNNFDGSVSMEIQGTEKQIDQVILAIERRTYVKIENMQAKTIPVVDGERSFAARDEE